MTAIENLSDTDIRRAYAYFPFISSVHERISYYRLRFYDAVTVLRDFRNAHDRSRDRRKHELLRRAHGRDDRNAHWD